MERDAAIATMRAELEALTRGFRALELEKGERRSAIAHHRAIRAEREGRSASLSLPPPPVRLVMGALAFVGGFVVALRLWSMSEAPRAASALALLLGAWVLSRLVRR